MKNIRIEIKWAILFVIMQLSWMVIERVAGFYNENIEQHPTFTNFIAIPAIAIYVFALLDKRKNFYNGSMSYKQGLITGLIISFFVTLISPLTQYITTTFIAQEYFPNVIKLAVEKGEMTQEAAEAYFNLKSYIIQGLIGAPVMGLITSALVALFTKTKVKSTVK